MLNILVIDDEKAVAKVICNALLRFGHRVITVGNGHEGIRLFDNEDFNLVITEISMSVMSGHEVVRYVRNSKRTDTPVIGISGVPWGVRETEFDMAITKPFTIKCLYNAVEYLTGHRPVKSRLAGEMHQAL